MKVCSTCKETKPLSEFNKKSANADGLERYCRLCHRERNKKHYVANTQSYITRARNRRSELVEWFKDFKHTLQCEVCGETKPWRLAFHHPDPTVKENSVSQLVAQTNSRRKIEAEIEKCMVLCHNCHSDVHNSY